MSQHACVCVCVCVCDHLAKSLPRSVCATSLPLLRMSEALYKLVIIVIILFKFYFTHSSTILSVHGYDSVNK